MEGQVQITEGVVLFYFRVPVDLGRKGPVTDIEIEVNIGNKWDRYRRKIHKRQYRWEGGTPEGCRTEGLSMCQECVFQSRVKKSLLESVVEIENGTKKKVLRRVTTEV